MVNFYEKKNNAKTTLSADVVISDTSIQVVSTSLFPATGDFVITIWDKETYTDPGDDPNMEVLVVTSVSGNVFTVSRAQESTTAKEHLSGHAVEILFTVGQIEELQTEINTNISAIATNASNIAANTSAIAGKEDSFTVGNGLDMISGRVLEVNESELVHPGLTNNPHSVTRNQLGLGVGDSVVFAGLSDGTWGVEFGAVAGAVSCNLVTGLVTQYLKLDTSNDPLTGNLEISKADPEIRLTDTGDNNYTRLTRSDILGMAQRFNIVKKPGGLGNALSFDGVDDEVLIGDTGETPIQYTIVLWANRDTISGAYATVIRLKDTFELTLFIYENGNIRFGSLATPWVTWNSVWTDKTSYHLVVIKGDTSLGKVELFFDNVSKGEQSLVHSGAWNNVQLGSRDLGTVFYIGEMDEVALWKEKLSNNDISDIWNGGSSYYLDPSNSWPTDGGSIGTNLVGLWHHDELVMNSAPGGTDTEDSSGNGFHGTTDGSMTDGDFVSGKVTSVAVDVEINVWRLEDGTEANEAGILTIGDNSTNRPRLILEGGTLRFNIAGSEKANVDNMGTWTISNGISTAQQLILKAAASATENIQEWQDSSGNTLTSIDQNGNALFGNAVKAYFRDSAIGIYSQANTFLDLFADGSVRIGNSSGGAPTNYSEFEADGTLKFNGDATVWDDLRVPLSSIKRLGFSDPSWVQFKDDGAVSTGVYVLSFSNLTDEEVFFAVQLPHSYKEGTNIVPHVHWAPSDGNSGGVTWGLEYTWANIEGTYGNTTIITVDDSTDTTSHKHHVADFSAISGSGKTISSILMCRLFRDISDPNDDYGSGAFLLEIDFHYEIDTIGSRQILIK